jgi:transposase InsO family protein
VIKEFHSDNGSEFINRKVAATLTELKAILSKSRPRRHNDNALVEGKNAWIIRKHHGYGFIAKTHVTLVRRWQEKWLNPYLNFHRPCGYATVTYKENGKEVRRYSPDNYQTPYERFKGVENPEQYLKPGLTLAKLDKIGYARSDTEHAKAMQEGKDTLAEALRKLEKADYLPT